MLRVKISLGTCDFTRLWLPETLLLQQKKKMLSPKIASLSMPKHNLLYRTKKFYTFLDAFQIENDAIRI